MKHQICVAFPVYLEVDLEHEVTSEDELTDEELDSIMNQAEQILNNNTIKPVIHSIDLKK